MAEFRVSPENLIDVGAELTADHFIIGQFVDVTGTSIGKGFQGVMKRHNFSGGRATHGNSVSHRTHGSTGQRQDPGKVFKGKKMAGHMGDVRVTTQNLKIVRTDVPRGLIMVEGAVPGAKGGWILVRDAVKRPLPDGVPTPGAVPQERRCPLLWPLRPKPRLRRRPSDGPQGHHPRRQVGRTRSRCRTRSSVSSRAPTSCSAWSAGSSSKRQAGTHKTKTRGEIRMTSKKAYKQKGTGQARHGNKAAPQFRGGGKAFGPVVRSHEHDLPKKVRALALKHALSGKAKGEKLIVIAEASAKDNKTKALAAQFAKLGLTNALIIDGAAIEDEFPPRRPQHPRHRRPADPGDQRLRHPAPRHAGPDQGRGRSADGAVQMNAHSHYDVIRSPVITEKSTALSEHNKVVFKVAPDANKAEIKAAVEALFKVKVTAVNTLDPQGQGQALPWHQGTPGRQQAGHRDPGRGLVDRRDDRPLGVSTMALKKYKPTTPSQRQLVLVDRSELYKGKPVKGLVEGKHSTGGRNNYGRITVRWRGGGHKRAYRIIDFKRRKLDMPATVERLEYDPNRTAFIALIRYEDGELSYILAPQRLAVGDTVSPRAGRREAGQRHAARAMPVGTIVHNVEMKLGAGGQIARSAGTYAQYRRPRPGLRDPAAEFGRAAPGQPELLRHGRRGVQSRPRQHQSSARRAATAGSARAGASAASP